MSEPLHIVCPHCHTTNRVRPEDLAKAADCGSCHRALFDGHPAALGEAAFERHIQRNQVPVLVDFWAPWCGPCRSMAPIFQRAAEALEPRARFVKVNVDDNQDAARRYGVQSIPALFVFKGGQVAERQAGLSDLAVLRGWVDRLAA